VAIGEVADHSCPSLTKNYHHEVELVAALKSGGTNIAPEKAWITSMVTRSAST
jgi:2-keto-4-pentenoate hydratase/2-oxohepta-3-ene-1,7-dioic acid hydratase in catechol pathway